MTQGQIEQIKLTANLLNALASGTIIAAIVAPYIGIGFGSVRPPDGDVWNLLALSGFGFIVGVVLHLIARRSLGGIW